MLRAGRWPALAVAAALLLTGCARWTELSYRVDKRLAFTAPKDRSLVTVPFRVSWTMRDYDAGYFAVFIDRSPVGPGHRVEDIAKGDRACTTDPSCPDAAYLAERGVYTTHDTSVEITRVKDLGDNSDVQLHLLYVVLMDPSGHRIGETSYRTEFKLKRKATAS